MANTPTKPTPLFPAPEWTSVSAQMAATLAHEIRNPLLSIKGAAQLLAQIVGPDDQTLTQLIINEANRIDQLVGELDPLTPHPHRTPERINIHELTEYARLAVLSYAPQVQIAVQYDPSLPEIRGLREPLIQALLNLLKNAIESAQSSVNPIVTITTRYLIGERMQRTGSGEKLPIAISITDNGPGVAAEIIPRLFTPFTTGKPQGKGLGLAIVAKIVEEHHGLIAHDVPKANGAQFTIYLPLA